MLRIVTIFGKKVEFIVHQPTNAEYNAYSDSVMKCESDEDLRNLRLQTFDAWVEKINGMNKEDILDRQKGAIIYQLFEKVEISEKN